MGWLDGVLGKSPGAGGGVGGVAKYSIGLSFRPVRLSAHTNSPVELLLDIRNIGTGSAPTSVLVELPATLGFDNVGATKSKELRLGVLNPGQGKQASILINGSSQTPQGSYRIAVSVSAHYRDYEHVVSTQKKVAELRVV